MKMGAAPGLAAREASLSTTALDTGKNIALGSASTAGGAGPEPASSPSSGAGPMSIPASASTAIASAAAPPSSPLPKSGITAFSTDMVKAALLMTAGGSPGDSPLVRPWPKLSRTLATASAAALPALAASFFSLAALSFAAASSSAPCAADIGAVGGEGGSELTSGSGAVCAQGRGCKGVKRS